MEFKLTGETKYYAVEFEGKNYTLTWYTNENSVSEDCEVTACKGDVDEKTKSDILNAFQKADL